MDSLNTAHPLALSILLNEDLYVIEPVETTPNTEVITAQKEEPKAAVENKTVIPVLQNTPIETQESAKAQTPVSKPVFNYLGDNNKYLLIIVNDTTHQFINDKDLAFLLKILAAKKLDLHDIAILNTKSYTDLTFKDLKDYFACNKILTFGIDPKSLQIQGITANKAGEFDSVKILGTWALSLLDTDVKKKTVYWNELKNF
ncbi:hypothetical protein FYC62_10360 [Pedobacter aquae]|uniref:Uncharacterized protein n=1 Tax=Pedobacter aquae TaxID=2605747 RepID=A0A5C0VLG5_9SPHI|nr:hypothetical protein [Pedobacter aquae]QEK52010.1 hypothetical protein FYC62_10360 [Pedobacter aquae]